LNISRFKKTANLIREKCAIFYFDVFQQAKTVTLPAQKKIFNENCSRFPFLINNDELINAGISTSCNFRHFLGSTAIESDGKMSGHDGKADF